MTNSADDLHFDDALAAFSKDNFDTALVVVSAFLAKHPESAKAHHLMAQISVRLGNHAAALNSFATALELAPKNWTLLLDMGHVYQILGNNAEAAECYRKCSELNPNDGYVRELYSQSLLEQWMSALQQRKIGREASKSYAAKVYSGFFKTYLSGAHILDIGYRGGFGEAEPIVHQAIGIDFGFPGYDGVHLPFADNSQDAVYTSHCLEHMNALPAVLTEWLRVLKIGGYAVIVVPHQYLYERKSSLPSRHPDHRHFFTPGKLLAAIEDALPPNHYRVRHLMDNDLLYDYSLPPNTHPVGCYEIELVLEKIKAPIWSLQQ